ncbi:hypothetical protein KVH01_22910 [Pseudomonas sp. SWRI124]|nr:hypothetical protein [Pseudomonas khavaziana]
MRHIRDLLIEHIAGQCPGAVLGLHHPREAMQAYLDWEFGLVAQLARDGTHGFYVI